MISFESIYTRAIERKGGKNELHDLLPEQISFDGLSAIDENRFLAEMTRCVFQSGFSRKVIGQKWDGFEDMFLGFDVNAILGLIDDDWKEIAGDRRIVRNRQKISSVRINAQFIEDISSKFGSFPRYIAEWPESDLTGLFTFLKKRGSRLGGNTGQRFLRNMGKDTFILSKDVVTCMRNTGLEIKDVPNTKREYLDIQQVFNQWHEETSISYTHLSKIMAYSVD